MHIDCSQAHCVEAHCNVLQLARENSRAIMKGSTKSDRFVSRGRVRLISYNKKKIE